MEFGKYQVYQIKITNLIPKKNILMLSPMYTCEKQNQCSLLVPHVKMMLGKKKTIKLSDWLTELITVGELN